MGTIRLSLFLMLCLGFHRSSTKLLKRQKRNWIIDSFAINEGYGGPFPYNLGKIEIEKNYTFFEIHGEGVEKEPIGLLKIDSSSGMITVNGPVDHEKYKVLKLAFQARNKESLVIDTRLGIEITIEDANDNPPVFTLNKYEVSIKEATVQGTELTTVMASDKDSTLAFRTFDFTLKQVTPKEDGLKFYLEQSGNTASISFYGCLDHESAEKYALIVEAKDKGTPNQLSSSSTIIINIEDGNNHLPKITGQTGPGKVKEGVDKVEVARIQVTDTDQKDTDAWRAKYSIQGDTDNNFIITTDPKTNEGILYVEKELDYEKTNMKDLIISVENLIAYSSCEVESRSSTGLWKVVTSGGAAAGTGIKQKQSTRKVTVMVEDVNESPFFDTNNYYVHLIENTVVGKYLKTVTAKDPDTATTSKIAYAMGDDPASWVTVDSKTGKITTKDIIDRESSFVKKGLYNVTILAVDNGKPAMTGTTTVVIRVGDENDNVPSLPENIIDICDTDGQSMTNITAVDPDEEPYGGPFTFKLDEKHEGKWKLDPTEGFSVDLVREPIVHSGDYELTLEISDLQGKKSVQTLLVTVCKCLNPARPSCRIRAVKGSSVGPGGLGIIFFGLLLLAGVLLLAFLLSCEKKHCPIPSDESVQNLMTSNIEKRGTDCRVESFNRGQIQSEEVRKTSSAANVKKTNSAAAAAAVMSMKHISMPHNGMTTTEFHQRDSWMGQSTMEQSMAFGNSMNQSMGAASMTNNRLRNSMRGTWGGHSQYSSNRNRFQDSYAADSEDVEIQRSTVLNALNRMLYRLQAPEEELGDYAPHEYAEEGDTRTRFELDAISIADDSFDPAKDLDLDDKFHTLASVCMQNTSSGYSTTSYTQVSNIVNYSDLHASPTMDTPLMFAQAFNPELQY
ncbi:cadherin-like protein 26 [Centropristis striata]|uniref:cadherin-like protein 26 n=1 Tax=Centropristis striata TaxID=184440 RepID=UPI0027DFEE4C|nr:cadherin-like protein 26 [Centropristis striata]